MVAVAVEVWRDSLQDVVDRELLTEAEADQLALHRATCESVELALAEEAREAARNANAASTQVDNCGTTMFDRQLARDDEIKHQLRVIGQDPSEYTFTERQQMVFSPDGQLASHNGAEPNSRRPLVGLTFAEAKAREIPPRNELVAELVDAGTVGLIAGLPFARKSWAALELAHKVAAGRGEVFGRFEIVKPGPVLYVWQDDSTAKELERIQRYAGAHDYPDDLPLRFLLNEDVRLPDDIDPLAEMVERDGVVLVVVDSLYNALSPTVKLKDEEVSVVLAQIKAGLCDRTGAGVGLVDHAPWPTEGNRGQRRAYGSVFKTAAVRWSIHLEADAKDDTRLHVEASGNNVAGFRRTPARWDEEALEIRLLEPEVLDEEALDEAVLAWVIEHPGEPMTKIAAGVEKRRENVSNSLDRLGHLGKLHCKTSRDLGRAGTGHYWFPLNHAGFEVSGNGGTPQDSLFEGSASDGEVSDVSHPVGGTPHLRDASKRSSSRDLRREQGKRHADG